MMSTKGRWSLTLALAVAVAGCGSHSETEPTLARVTEPPPAPPTTAPTEIANAVEHGLLPPVTVVGEDPRMDLQARMQHHGIPGISIAVFENYEIVWSGAYGTANASTGREITPRTLLQAASISKPVNAMAVLLAAEAGDLSLDAPINELLRSWNLPDNEHTAKSPVTLRHLLSHTGGTTVHGFPGYATAAPLPTAAQVLDGETPANTDAVRVNQQPGLAFRYSGGGTTISQIALVDSLGGTAYPDILANLVLQPLGMLDSTYAQPLPADRLGQAAAAHHRSGTVVAGDHHVYPEMAAAGLWTTPTDLARFFLAISRARAGKPSPVPETVARAMTTRGLSGGEPGTNVSLGTFVYSRNGVEMFGHGGANHGFRSIARVGLDTGYGFVMMANSDNGFALFVEIERALMGRPGWPGNPPALTRAAVPAAELASMAGRYAANGALAFTIAVTDGRIEYSKPFRQPVELIAVGDRRFIARDSGAAYTFAADGQTATITAPPGIPAPAMQVERLADDDLRPLAELDAGRFDAAVAAWRALEKDAPKSAALDEARFNNLGYEQLIAGDIDRAIDIFRFVTVVRPDSSNAFDSLGEALAAANRRDQAIAAYEAALAKLADDATIATEEKPRRRAHAEEQLAKLRGEK